LPFPPLLLMPASAPLLLMSPPTRRLCDAMLDVIERVVRH
jgi:hypothetical protein